MNRNPSLQDIYNRRCIRKARRIINDSSHPSHRLFSLLPSWRRLGSIRSCTSRLRDSFFPSGYQANEQSELIHPTAHSHFTICHTLYFNSTVQTGLHVHTALIQQSICYHWIPSNAHPWHLHIQLMYNLLHLCILHQQQTVPEFTWTVPQTTLFTQTRVQFAGATPEFGRQRSHHPNEQNSDVNWTRVHTKSASVKAP